MPSRTQWIYYVICALGLSIYLWAGAVQMRTSALPDDVAIEGLSYPVRVGGRTAGSPKELAFLVQGLGVGRQIDIVQSDGRRITTQLVGQFSIIHRVSTYLSGFCFWAVCLVFFAPRTDRPANRDFFWASFFYGLAVMVGGVFHPVQPYGEEILLPVLRIFAIALVMAFFVLLSLEFPQEHRWFRDPPFAVRTLFAVPIAVALWYSLALVNYLLQPSPERYAGLAFPAQFSRLVFVAYFVAGGALFYRSGSRADRSREKAQAKWILWGIGFGAVPFVFLFTLPQIFGLESLIPLEYTRLFSIACPLSFAVAVVRYQFLDIDVIIRRSLIYFCLAGVMVFVYILIGVWIGGRIQSRVPEVSRAISIVSVIIPVILFNPTHRWIGRFVDRTFFKIRDTYNKAIANLQDLLQETLGNQQIVRVLHASLRDNLRPKQSAVLLRFQDQTYRAVDQPGNEQLSVRLAELPVASSGIIAKRSSTSVPELETENFPERYRELGYLLAVPMSIADECEGLVLLGEKESERRYVEQDLDFILGAVSKVRPVLERIVLVQRVAEEALARRQLAELNRLKSDFLSSVAHDIRTPLTSIQWSSQNLMDGVAGETNHNQRSYLQAIQASTSHLSRLVNNLLEISRLEVGGTEISLEPVDVEEVANSVLLSLKPIADAKRVVFQMRSKSLAQRARANHGMTLEVVNNLIDNAIKFSPVGSEIDIELTQHEEWCKLAVRDRGPGIHESDREVIFERFRQGRHDSTGSQQGFGLGLFVVKSFVEAVDGKVWAENHPDGGARFVCLLPAWPSQGEVH
jgi:signal transduction histidine kinase